MEQLMVILAPVSVAALIVASWLAGGWRSARLAGADDARARLAADEPDFAVARVLVAADRRAALLAGDPEGAGVGAVIALGDKLVTRRFGPGEVLAVYLDDGLGNGLNDGKAGPRLRIVTSDPTCRRVTLRLGAEAGRSPAVGAANCQATDAVGRPDPDTEADPEAEADTDTDTDTEADTTASAADLDFWMTLLRRLAPGHAPGAPVAHAVAPAPVPSPREE